MKSLHGSSLSLDTYPRFSAVALSAHVCCHCDSDNPCIAALCSLLVFYVEQCSGFKHYTCSLNGCSLEKSSQRQAELLELRFCINYTSKTCISVIVRKAVRTPE